jgi:hypothetical protein
MKEGEYGGNTTYSCIKMEQWDLLKLFWQGGMRKKDVWVNLSKTYCKKISKCHNVPPGQL